MPKSLNERIEEHLTYGENKSEWLREAAKEKLNRETETEKGAA